MPFAMYYVVKTTYQNRIVTNMDNIPYELRTLVVAYDYNDITSNPAKFNPVVEEINKLYLNKKINNIYIFALSTDSIPVKEEVEKHFKDIPKDNLLIDNKTTDPLSLCTTIKDTYKLNKFLTMSYLDYLVRIGYICNSVEIYTVGYQPDTIKWATGQNMFTNILKDIAKFNFNF
jgi:hypothetical protein